MERAACTDQHRVWPNKDISRVLLNIKTEKKISCRHHLPALSSIATLLQGVYISILYLYDDFILFPVLHDHAEE